MRHILLLLLTSVVANASFGQSQDTSLDERAIRGVIHNLQAAWTDGDGDAWAAQFLDDADFVVWFGMALSGKEEIAWGHNVIFETFYANTTFALTVNKIRFLGSDVAIVHLAGSVVANGETPPDIPDAVPVAVVTRTDAGWRVATFQNTPFVVDEFRENGDLKRFKRLAADQAKMK